MPLPLPQQQHIKLLTLSLLFTSATPELLLHNVSSICMHAESTTGPALSINTQRQLHDKKTQLSCAFILCVGKLQ
ncbi:hypothetical protein COO60DRAFT_768497 [Scenedesmus sp. NREL 46B-D3]|nr:hypothetical protein COO60DRAFT_768497 [Scenedesmus sp. NREL 46B-D3]